MPTNNIKEHSQIPETVYKERLDNRSRARGGRAIHWKGPVLLGNGLQVSPMCDAILAILLGCLRVIQLLTYQVNSAICRGSAYCIHEKENEKCSFEESTIIVHTETMYELLVCQL